MRVRDWMSPDPVTVEPSTPVAEARRLLHRYGIRHLPVVDRDQVVGMVSDRDVRISETSLHEVADGIGAAARSALAEVAGVGLAVEAVMSTPAHVITAGQPVEAAARLMLSRRISALPVLDDGALVGVITTTDCLLASLTPMSASSPPPGER